MDLIFYFRNYFFEAENILIECHRKTKKIKSIMIFEIILTNDKSGLISMSMYMYMLEYLFLIVKCILLFDDTKHVNYLWFSMVN